MEPLDTRKRALKSSLTFLRRTPWARAKVEELYLERIVDFKKEGNYIHVDSEEAKIQFERIRTG